jgi:hypothetical protein
MSSIHKQKLLYYLFNTDFQFTSGHPSIPLTKQQVLFPITTIGVQLFTLPISQCRCGNLTLNTPYENPVYIVMWMARALLGNGPVNICDTHWQQWNSEVMQPASRQRFSK